MGLSSLRVDDQDYSLDFEGFGSPLRATLPDGRALELQPWSLGQHFAALGACAALGEGGLRVDPRDYAAQVLGGADPGDWLGLVLWWAAGGGGGAHGLSGVRVRPWSLAERARVIRACVSEDGAFDLSRYLGEMMRACVEGDADPVALPTHQGLPLQAEVNAANTPDDVLLQDPALRRVVLRLATALGWAPSRTLATPAGEVDQLLALLDSAPRQPAAPPAPSAVPASAPAAFAMDPDATIIRIDGD